MRISIKYTTKRSLQRVASFKYRDGSIPSRLPRTGVKGWPFKSADGAYGSQMARITRPLKHRRNPMRVF